MYSVILRDRPIATYEGEKAGIPRTKPEAGKKLDTRSDAAQKLRKSIDSTRNAVLDSAKVNKAKQVYKFETALAGTVVRMTKQQAAALAKDKRVLAVSKNEIVKADTSYTPDYYKLTGPGGVWQKQYGGDANAGAGVIVGVVDTGIEWTRVSTRRPTRSRPRRVGSRGRRESTSGGRASARPVATRSGRSTPNCSRDERGPPRRLRGGATLFTARQWRLEELRDYAVRR